MAVVSREAVRPTDWAQFIEGKPKWVRPYLRFEWVLKWTAYFLAQWALLEVLEYIGSFSILAAVVLYFAGSHDRLVQKHYAAWQVINTAQGKGGAGGRIDAMQDLNEDRVSLVGIDVTDAVLERIQLPRAELRRAEFAGADLKGADLSHANLEEASMRYANIRDGKLVGVNFSDTFLKDVDLTNADVAKANFHNADLEDAELAGLVNWQSIADISGANIAGVEDAPEGFIKWATENHAVVKPTSQPSTKR